MSTEVKKNIIEEIRIPDNVSIELKGSLIKIVGPLGENEFNGFHPRIFIKKEGNKLILNSKQNTKNEKKILMTFIAHINNLLNGVLKEYIYKLKICSGHFPMNVSLSGNDLTIKNFFAEKIPRHARILQKVKVKIDSDIITVSGINKESVSQTAANIEQACRITNRDRRVFMDGIYIISKGDE